jgi:hypothetical protein
MFIQFLLAAALRYAYPKTFRPAHNPTIGNYAYVFVISDSDVELLNMISAHLFLKEEGCSDGRGHWPRHRFIQSIAQDDYVIFLQ